MIWWLPPAQGGQTGLIGTFSSGTMKEETQVHFLWTHSQLTRTDLLVVLLSREFLGLAI